MGILSYGYKAFKGIKKAVGKGKVSPTITQPRQLKTTMKKIRSQYERFGFDKAKTAKDRANIVRKKKSIERMDKLEALQKKRKAGIKASKDVKKMVDTGQANKVGGSVFSKTVRERKMGGGMMGRPMYKKGGKSFPDLTGDGKVTQADILKGRGVFGKGGVSKKIFKNIQEKAKARTAEKLRDESLKKIFKNKKK